jgi:hypothetical protein
MTPDKPVWVFSGSGKSSRFPGAVFSNKTLADEWIIRNRLTGVLTAYPLDQGCFDWALAHDATGMNPETLARKREDPEFIGSFSTAIQTHFHYEVGVQVSDG